MKLLYRCYSENLRSYLQSHGQSYELKAVDIKTNAPFYAFVKTDALEYLLRRWQSPKGEEVKDECRGLGDDKGKDCRGDSE